MPLVARRPAPDRRARVGMGLGLVHRQPLRQGLLRGDDQVDVAGGAQAARDGLAERVRVGRQRDPQDRALLGEQAVDEARVLVRIAVVVLAPRVRREQDVERPERQPPRDLVRHLEPLGVLRDLRVDDLDERLVAREQGVPAGLEVALEEALAEVLGEDLDDAPVRREAAVGLVGPCVRPPRHLEHGPELVRFELVRAEDPEVAVVLGAHHHLAQVRPDLVERAGVRRAGLADRDGHDRRVGQLHRPPHPPADRVVDHAESQVALRERTPGCPGPGCRPARTAPRACTSAATPRRSRGGPGSS